MMEVMIAIIITAVLAALAIPSYRNSVEQARSNEATTNLNIIHAGEKLYILDNPGQYKAAGLCTATGTPVPCAAINGNLTIDITAQFYTLNVTTGVGTYTATASRIGGSTKVYTITQTGAITSAGSF
jgi:type IV pilus assembly protein PilE